MPREARLLVFFSMLPIIALLALVNSSPLWGQEGEHFSRAISSLNLDGRTELVESVEKAEQRSASHPPRMSSEPPQYELFLLVNQERISRGIPALGLAPGLANAAQFHSEWMADHDCFAHNCSGEPGWTTRIEDAGYLNHTKLGENIAGGYTSASAVVNAWMNSSPHRSQLLDPGFRDAGGGYAYSSTASYRHYWTLDLGARKERLPVVLIHGWHGPDDVEKSQFRYMRDWLEADEYEVYYATGITADRSLQQNAPILKDYIDYVKDQTGASKVIIIGHSRGGLNARAYVESSLYEGDVDRVVMLGTPNAGADLLLVRAYLYEELARELIGLRSKNDVVSIHELDPEYMQGTFNRAYHNDRNVPYYLIGGDGNPILWAIPNDIAVTVASVHSATGSRNVYMRTHDVHGWNSWSQLFGKDSYLLPRHTYDACIRPALAGAAPGDECFVASSTATGLADSSQDMIRTPYQSDVISAGDTITHSISITATTSAQFHLAWDQGNLELSLLDPVGTTIDPSYADTSPTVDFTAFEPDMMFNYNMYAIEDGIAGTWTLTVTADYTESMDVSFSTFAMLEPTLDLEASTDKTLYDLNEPVAVTATVSYGFSGLAGANVEALIGRPDLVTATLTLHDDGAHADGLADDGTYGNAYANTDVGGPYALFVTAEGMLDSVSYARADEVQIQVSPETGQLAGSYSDYPEDADSNGRYEYLATEVGIDVHSPGDFLVSGILLGPGDEEIASTVHPISLSMGTQTALLRFDGDLIYWSGLDGPYTLTQVLLMDNAGLPIKLDGAHDAWITPAYEHAEFGLNEVTALPVAMKNF